MRAAFAVVAAVALGAPVSAGAATITVNTAADEANADGDCSLREAVATANGTATDACAAGASGADTIQLAAAGPYPLSAGEMAVSEALTVMGDTGDRADRVIDPNLSSRVFNATATLTVRDLTIRKALTGGDGGAILSTAPVTATGVAFEDASAANGGAIFSSGSVTVTGSVFDNDDATTGGGGAVYSGNGPMTITDSEFQDHDAVTDGGAVWSGGTLNLNGENQFFGSDAGNRGGVAYGEGAVNVTGQSTFGGLAAGKGNTAGAGGGGAIHAGGNVDVNGNTQFIDNDSTGPGGAIAVESPATLTIRSGPDFTGNDASTASGTGGCAKAAAITVQTGSTFTDNSAGGAGGCLAASTANVNGATFLGNDTTTDYGGAINATTSLTVDGSTFGGAAAGQGNTADGGGGAIRGEGSATVTDSGFEGNSSIGAGEGGAISSFGQLVVARSTFTGNRVGDAVSSNNLGGAIVAVGTLQVIDSTFTSNVAQNGHGGAVMMVSDTAGSSILNSTITANSAPSDAVVTSGGGVAMGGTGAASIVHSTLYDNDSGTGDIDNFTNNNSTLTLRRSIVADDPVEADAALCAGPITDGGLNVVFSAPGTCPTGGTNATGDPVLGLLADNGGPTQTMLPGAGSSAVDLVPAPDCPAGPIEDQRGVARPVGPGCDPGAVEVDSKPDALVRRDTDAFVGGNVYEQTPTTQVVTKKVKDGVKAKFTVRAQSDAEFLTEPFLLTATAGTDAFKTTYKVAGVNETAAITGAGYVAGPLSPGESVDIDVAVKVKKGTKAGKKQTLDFTTASQGYGTHLDAVELTAIAK